MEYGYVRVSTQDQNVQRQVKALLDQGIDERKIYIDRCSGKNFERAGYRRLMRRLRQSSSSEA